MCMQVLTTQGVPTRETLLTAIDDLHAQLNEGFGSLCESAEAVGYEADPARLHRLVDGLSECVATLTLHASLALSNSATGQSSKAVAEPYAPQSLTGMLERLSGLVDTTRDAALAAAESHDWSLTDELAELAHRFEESLWFMVVSIQDGLNAALANDRPGSGSSL